MKTFERVDLHGNEMGVKPDSDLEPISTTGELPGLTTVMIQASGYCNFSSAFRLTKFLARSFSASNALDFGLLRDHERTKSLCPLPGGPGIGNTKSKGC